MFEELKNIPKERLGANWEGTGALLQLYEEASGKDREAHCL